MRAGRDSDPLPLLVPRSKIEKSYTSFSLRAFVAYERVKPTYQPTYIYMYMYTWKDNEVGELATVCLSWQHWTKV